jgi:3-dehydroquinate dehydratase
MMIVIASVAVALVSFIVYALERRSKTQAIDWIDASKITIFGGIITACVVFATTSEVVVDAVKNIEISAVQDIFVGKPTF